MVAVAEALESGTGVESDTEAAIRWYEKAVEQDNPDACYWLGMCYAKGWSGVPEQLFVARELLERAAQEGHEDAERELKNLRRRMRVGRGDKSDTMSSGPRLAGDAPRSESHDPRAVSLYDQGIAYWYGNKTTKRDQEKAFGLFKEAAHLGHGESLFAVAEAYRKAEGVVADLEEAYRYYMLAAAQSDKRAKDQARDLRPFVEAMDAPLRKIDKAVLARLNGLLGDKLEAQLRARHPLIWSEAKDEWFTESSDRDADAPDPWRLHATSGEDSDTILHLWRGAGIVGVPAAGRSYGNAPTITFTIGMQREAINCAVGASGIDPTAHCVDMKLIGNAFGDRPCSDALLECHEECHLQLLAKPDAYYADADTLLRRIYRRDQIDFDGFIGPYRGPNYAGHAVDGIPYGQELIVAFPKETTWREGAAVFEAKTHEFVDETIRCFEERAVRSENKVPTAPDVAAFEMLAEDAGLHEERDSLQSLKLFKRLLIRYLNARCGVLFRGIGGWSASKPELYFSFPIGSHRHGTGRRGDAFWTADLHVLVRYDGQAASAIIGGHFFTENRKGLKPGDACLESLKQHHGPLVSDQFSPQALTPAVITSFKPALLMAGADQPLGQLWEYGSLSSSELARRVFETMSAAGMFSQKIPP